jgi:hypothetical protein
LSEAMISFLATACAAINVSNSITCKRELLRQTHRLAATGPEDLSRRGWP